MQKNIISDLPSILNLELNLRNAIKTFTAF